MKPKPERDVTAEFVELMAALDCVVDFVEPHALDALDAATKTRIGRVIAAHLEFRDLVETYDTVIHRDELPMGQPRH